MKTRIFKTNTAIYSVSKNDDGTLTVIREYFYKYGQWQKDGSPIQNAGMFINQQGGIDALVAKCTEMDDLAAWVEEYNAAAEELQKKKHEETLVRQAEREAQIKAEYERLFCGEVTESNEETVGALLRYLNTQNWGVWHLPKMTIGYACHQYDCDGQTATTIKLDKPITVNDEPGTIFQVGAPHGHLMKYRRI